MLISELMSNKTCRVIRHIRPDSGLHEMAEQLFQHQVGVLLVINDAGDLVGVVSERDLVRAVARQSHSLFQHVVADIMTPNILTCSPDDDVTGILNLLDENNIRHIPVMRDGAPVAILSIKDFYLVYQMLEIEARTDHLTGLSNRRRFMELLEDELSRCRRFRSPLSLAILDIDHFKGVNDTYGHEAGDSVLRSLAAVMIKELRAYDGVGRLGGEEFAMVLPHTDLQGAMIACNRIIESIRRDTVATGGHLIRYTASIGLVELMDQNESIDDALKRADDLLYRAKAEGRDRIVFSSASLPMMSMA